MSEAHVPTEHSPSGEKPRVPASHVDARGPSDHRGPSAEGPHAPERLIRHAAPVWRLRGRHNIESVRRARRRASGPVWVRWLSLDTAAPPEVGYAIGRHVGPAVTRNRVRRRLRAAVAELAADLAPGRCLMGATADAARIPFNELTRAVRTSLEAAGALPSGAE